MEKTSAGNPGGIRDRMESLLVEVCEFSKEKSADALTATDELLMNKDADKTPKLFLEYMVADREQRHVATACQYVIKAMNELEKAENVRRDMKRGLLL